MLMKYFEYEELKCLKEQVIEEHSKWHFYDLEKHTFEKAETGPSMYQLLYIYKNIDFMGTISVIHKVYLKYYKN